MEAAYLSSSISQNPAFSWWRSEHTDWNVELYNLRFFSELITTQLRISHGVTMQSYKFYLNGRYNIVFW